MSFFCKIIVTILPMLCVFSALESACSGHLIHATCFIPTNTIDLSQYGAVGDGVADDTAAIQAWLNSAQSGCALTAPAGVFAFSSPLVLNVSNVSVSGAGPYQTIFKYIGSNQAVDLFTVGTQSAETRNVYLNGFKVTSSTVMTNGAGMRFVKLCRSQLDHLIADGQDGTGNLYHGFWFDKVDFVRLNGYEARGSADAIRVNGTVGAGPKADLLLNQGKIAGSNIGLHIGGAFGGFVIDSTDLIANNLNVLIDNAIAAEGNREIFFCDGCLIDSALVGDSVIVNDSIATSGTIQFDGWVVTGPANGINIQQWKNGKVSIKSPAIFNFGQDGIRIEDPTCSVSINNTTMIHDNGGYAVNATVPTTAINSGSLFANGAGNYSANATVESLSAPSGYIKFPDGKIMQWLTIYFTGPENEILSSIQGNPVALPIPFPNANLDGLTTTSVEGFSNGPATMSATATPYANTAVYVNLVSSVPVENPQAVRIVVWGY